MIKQGDTVQALKLPLFFPSLALKHSTAGILPDTAKTGSSLQKTCCVFTVPLQHDIEQGIADIFSWDGQGHQLHTGDVQGMGRRVGELVEPPVTVGERTGGFSCHGWKELREGAKVTRGGSVVSWMCVIVSSFYLHIYILHV